MTIYERNMQALEGRENLRRLADYCRLADGTTAERGASSVKILQAKNGESVVTICKDGKSSCLTSRYNPTHAAERFLQDYGEMPDYSGLVFFGLSTGVYVRTFFKENKNQVFSIVYEPCANLFLELMYNVDLCDLFENPRFFLAVKGINDGDLVNFLCAQNRYDNRYEKRYLSLPQYQTLFSDDLKFFYDTILENEQNYQILINTALKLGDRFGYTCIQNMRYLPGCRAGYEYIHAFPEDMPVVVVAAGPSLEKNVDLLRKVKGKALTIVVDSAIRTVFCRGIRPDFVITVDNAKELKNFDAEGVEDVFLLADMSANTDVFDKVKPKNLVFYSADSAIWDRLFKEEGTEILEIYSGGSVALDAIAFSIVMGFKKIILIGQDLAMTGGKQYADGDMLANLNAMKMMKIKDIYGNDIWTKGDYYSFIQCIEKLAYQYPEVEIIDATEGGAYKKNTTIMTFQQAIDMYCTQEYPITEIIEKNPRIFVKNGAKKVIFTLQKMRVNIEAIREKMEFGSEQCGKAADMLIHKDFDKEKLLKVNQYIADLDKEYVNMEENGIFARVASKADYDFMTEVYDAEDEDIAEAIRLYKKSEQYYRGIAEAAPKIVAMIDECMEKTKKQYQLD